jgi:hypothetical protein
MMRTLVLVGMLTIVALSALPLSSATETCTITPIADGIELVTCDTNGDGIPNVVCVRLPNGECHG